MEFFGQTAVLGEQTWPEQYWRMQQAAHHAGEEGLAMGEIILRKPVILYETVEAIYQRVNGITFGQKKQDILLKYGQKLSSGERRRIEELCTGLSALADAACGGVQETPQLAYYFQRWDTESKWQNMCLAKLMIYSFLDIRVPDFQEALDRTLSTGMALLAKPYILFDINSGGMSFRPASPGETVPELVDQLDQIAIEEQYRWKIYKILRRFPDAFQELTELMRPVAARLETAMAAFLPLAQETYDHWAQYFQTHDFPDLLEQLTNQTVRADGLDTYINLSMLAGNDMIYTYGPLEGKNFRQVYIGVLINENFRVDRLQMTDEAICNLLKVISDRSKFEILRRISRSSSYCQELAREMNLTTATISRHMGLLLDAGLVRARRGENRIYYDLNREAITNLCDVVCNVLLQQ